METYSIGIDIGSISLKTVVLNSSGETVYSYYGYTEAKPKQTLLKVLQDIDRTLAAPRFSGIVFTGSGKKLYTEQLNVPGLNEIIAHARGCWEDYPEVASIIEIGGQDSKFIRIGREAGGAPFVENFEFNGLCSAGTGAFLDQQSGRLGMSIESFSSGAYRAPSAPPIAGRCSVFAKSDMVHLQQKGTDKDSIAAGLCFALARNYLATLCKGRKPGQPLAFQGGVAANKGMLRAFSEVLGIPEEEIIIPPYHKCAGAYGAALEAREKPLEAPRDLKEFLQSVEKLKGEKQQQREYTALQPSARSSAGWYSRNGEIYSDRVRSGSTIFLGLDIGSVTTKGVLLTEDSIIAASAETATRSEPVKAASEILRRLGEKVSNPEGDHGPRIGGFYTTGSGRHVVREVFRADGAVDEITAHARSAAHYAPETDTIIEIGGQDSKFIRLEQGAVKNFVMNRLCAAGTGSFLEEQAGRLSINIRDDFSRYAFRSESPSALGSRCTVFMDSDLVHHIQKGESAEDLCAGLAFSIVENYLENVSSSGEVGENIIFQGGVANNAAVHAAFESFLHKPVRLHPAPTFAGAVGAALIAAEEMNDTASIFPGFTAKGESYSVRYVSCEDCPNRCELMEIISGGGESIRFGSACGKHDTLRRPDVSPQGETPFDAYFRFVHDDYLKELRHEFEAPDRGRLVIPEGLTMYEDYPFWTTFFRALGYTVSGTGPGTPGIAEQGKELLPVETCMPVRMLYGHAAAAADSRPDYIFIPHTPSHQPDDGSSPEYLCPYTQTVGYIIRKYLNVPTLIAGKPQEEGRKEWLHRTAGIVKLPKREIERALELAEMGEVLFRKRCKAEGRKVLADLEENGGIGFVPIGRPYVAYDSCLNLDTAEKIRDFGVVPVPAAFLDTEGEELGPFWDQVHWIMGRKLLKAASFTRRHPSLFPLIMTSFGCGPDGFIVPFIEEILADSPRLVLEYDENRVDTGLLTRIEAFARSMKRRKAATVIQTGTAAVREHVRWLPDRPLEDYACYIPYFSDHAYAYAGALRAAGCSAEVLPSTDKRSLELARKYASGNECHPFLTILGDLLRLAEDGTPPGRESIYYSPKYVGSCLINAYETSMQLALDKMGVRDVHLLDFGNMQLMKELGLIYPYYLAMSSYAIDRLTKWAFEIAPSEEEPGAVMRTHKENMLRLGNRMEERKLMRGIKEAVDAMNAVPLKKGRKRPAVGIAGDVFTRINPAANFNLFEKLQNGGFDTMASALIMDVVLYRYEQLYRQLQDDGKPAASLGARLLLPAISVLKARVDRLFPDTLRTPQESRFPEVYERTQDFLDYRVDNLISLNLNRIYELHRAGAKGILNVMCPNCMIGTMSEAFFPEIKEDKKNLPITSLSFGDQQETHIDNRLEAFMHLVRELGNS